jgi:RHS repeat-associated protein
VSYGETTRAVVESAFLRQDNLAPLKIHAYDETQVPLWINRDPSGEPGGSNLYAMCANDTINYFDRNGKDRLSNAPWSRGDQNNSGLGQRDQHTPQAPDSDCSDVAYSGQVNLKINIGSTAAATAVSLGVQLTKTGKVRLQYNQLVQALKSKGFTEDEGKAARLALTKAFYEKQTAIGKALTDEFNQARQAAGYVPKYNNAFKANVEFNAEAKVFVSGGQALAFAGLAFQVYSVASAPPGEKLNETARQAGGDAGALVGGEYLGEAGLAVGGPPGAVVGGVVGSVGGAIFGNWTVFLFCSKPVNTGGAGGTW